VHLKNYAFGKTTNERFARRAQSSFSDAGETTTYMGDKTESESLLDDGNTSRGSIVDEEGARGSKKRRPRGPPRKKEYCRNLK
jgi:hypothetical protein